MLEDTIDARWRGSTGMSLRSLRPEEYSTSKSMSKGGEDALLVAKILNLGDESELAVAVDVELVERDGFPVSVGPHSRDNSVFPWLLRA